MTTITACCGHGETCMEPRCVSGLPSNFSDRECAAFVWLRGKMPKHEFRIGYLTKQVSVRYKRPISNSGAVTAIGVKQFAGLAECAKHYGWDG